MNYKSRTDKKPTYYRGSLCNVHAEDHDLETPGKFLKTRLSAVVCEDSHVNFLKRVPFSHVCFINNDDKILLQPSQSLNILVKNWRVLPKTKKFIASIGSRDFSDGYGRPSYSLKVLDDSKQLRKLRIDGKKVSEYVDLNKLISRRYWDCMTALVFPKEEIIKKINRCHPEVLYIPLEVYNNQAMLFQKRVTVADVIVHKNRERAGLNKSKWFPFRNKMDHTTVELRPANQIPTAKHITFGHPEIKKKFESLGLQFLHIRMGTSNGWIVNSTFFPNEYSKFIINHKSILTEIHRDHLVFEMMQDGVKVRLKLDYKRL